MIYKCTLLIVIDDHPTKLFRMIFYEVYNYTILIVLKGHITILFCMIFYKYTLLHDLLLIFTRFECLIIPLIVWHLS